MKTAIEPAFPASIGIVVDRTEGFEVVVITILHLVVKRNLVDGERQRMTTGQVVVVLLVHLGDGVVGRVPGEAFDSSKNHLFRNVERTDRVGRGI